MAASLSAFLAQNARKIETTKFIASDRFKDAEGNPIPWEIGCITAGEANRIRQSCIRQTGKRGQVTQSFDAGAYQAKLAARCTLYPSLDDMDLQDSYGVHTAEELIQTMLTPGEFEAYGAKVLEVNGFATTEEMVDEAKN